MAYLNGERVADRNAPGDLAWNSSAVRSHVDRLAVEFERVEIPGGAGLLRRGPNLLAIHGLNVRSGDRDFLLAPVLEAAGTLDERIVLEETTRIRARTLRGAEWSALSEAVFVVDGAFPLRVTEIMFHPADPPQGSPRDRDDFEFIELKNVGSETIRLAGARLEGGLEFDFSSSAILELDPGAFLLVVRDLDAFRARYGRNGLRVAGEYTGRLSNEGERLVLRGPIDETLLEFRYQDSWYPDATDGGGHSLVLASDTVEPGRYGESESWRPSRLAGGSPGEDDGEKPPAGLQIPGDASQDGRLNITDAIVLLNSLFHGVTPPCGEILGEGGNATLLDFDGDSRIVITDAVVLLRHLFAGGPPHARGTDCQPIGACPDVCQE